MAVVGGGVIGLTVAWRAAQSGLRVIVLERGELGRGASWVAAGMLAPVTEARLTELPLLELGVASAAMYPAFVSELRELTGIDPGYRGCGTLVVARDRDDAEALERELEVHRHLGLPVARLRPSEARRREPALAPTVRLALEVQDDHAIDPRRLSAALVAAARSAGAELHSRAEVRELTPPGLRLADGRRVAAEHVVIASGAWPVDGVPDHARVEVHPVKGQLLRLHDPSGPGLLMGVIRTGASYLVPRGDGRYVLGASMEERGFDTTVTAGAMFELLRDMVEVVPGVSELVIHELIAGLRPATGDGLPAIGPGALAGLHWAVGHFRNGILLAPITGQLVVAGITEVEPPPLARPFAPSRFDRAGVGV